MTTSTTYHVKPEHQWCGGFASSTETIVDRAGSNLLPEGALV